MVKGRAHTKHAISGMNSPRPDSEISQNKSGKLADKYKYVRFVERKKVLRKMRQLQKELLSAADDDRLAVESSLSSLRKDLLYIEKFPGKEKYISLFPSEGQLSEECLKKQKSIRDMIFNRTTMNEKASERRQIDSIKTDDFFASVDHVEKPTRDKAREKKPHTISPVQIKPKPKQVHPSWEAKKLNQKLTGSLSTTLFEGSRVVFNDDDD
jgi:hypothetical protein